MRIVLCACLALSTAACAPTAEGTGPSSVSGDAKRWACELFDAERPPRGNSLRASARYRLPRDLGLSRMGSAAERPRGCRE